MQLGETFTPNQMTQDVVEADNIINNIEQSPMSINANIFKKELSLPFEL